VHQTALSFFYGQAPVAAGLFALTVTVAVAEESLASRTVTVAGGVKLALGLVRTIFNVGPEIVAVTAGLLDVGLL
jgi:hypothetical protein